MAEPSKSEFDQALHALGLHREDPTAAPLADTLYSLWAVDYLASQCPARIWLEALVEHMIDDGRLTRTIGPDGPILTPTGRRSPGPAPA